MPPPRATRQRPSARSARRGTQAQPGAAGLDRDPVLKSRFEVFTALSLAAHLGLFAGAIVATRHSPPPRRSERWRGRREPAPRRRSEARRSTCRRWRSRPRRAAAFGERRGLRSISMGRRRRRRRQETRPWRPAATGASHASHRGAPRVAAAAPSEPPPAVRRRPGIGPPGDLVTTFKRVFLDRGELGSAVAARAGRVLRRGGRHLLPGRGRLAHPCHPTASAAAAPAFRAAILRTATLLKHRLFTAHGATTHLHMVVRVSDHLVYHGAFAIDAAGSFELPSGLRKTSVSITELR